MAGFIQLWRSFFSDELWKERREFSKAEAWLDILAMRSFRDDNMVKVGNSMRRVRKGECAISVSMLADRWKWPRKRVWTYLNYLENRGMIERRKEGKYENIIIRGNKSETIFETVFETINTDDNQVVKGKGETVSETVLETKVKQLAKKKEKEPKRKIENNKNIESVKRAHARTREGKLKFSGGIEGIGSVQIKQGIDTATREECRRIFREKGAADDMADAFYDYYAAQGWITASGRKLVNLESAINNWIRNEPRHRQDNNGSSARVERIKEHAAVAAEFRRNSIESKIRGDAELHADVPPF